MKILLISLLCLLPAGALAGNWVFVERCELSDCGAATVLGSANGIYVDADSVELSGTELRFWNRYQLDQSSPYGKTFMTRQEVDLALGQVRDLEDLWLDADNHVLFHASDVGDWRPYTADSSLGHQIDTLTPFIRP